MQQADNLAMPGTYTDEMTPFKELFRRSVLQHIPDELGAVEWTRLRQLAANRSRYVDHNDTTHAPDASPAALLATALSVDSISLQEVLRPWPTATPVAHVAGQPVYYIEGQGIYVWGESIDSSPVLMFWITHPAYPPSW